MKRSLIPFISCLNINTFFSKKLNNWEMTIWTCNMKRCFVPLFRLQFNIVSFFKKILEDFLLYMQHEALYILCKLNNHHNPFLRCYFYQFLLSLLNIEHLKVFISYCNKDIWFKIFWFLYLLLFQFRNNRLERFYLIIFLLEHEFIINIKSSRISFINELTKFHAKFTIIKWRQNIDNLRIRGIKFVLIKWRRNKVSFSFEWEETVFFTMAFISEPSRSNDEKSTLEITSRISSSGKNKMFSFAQ